MASLFKNLTQQAFGFFFYWSLVQKMNDICRRLDITGRVFINA